MFALKRKSPDLWPPIGVSKKESASIKWLHAIIFSLGTYVDAFEAALALYRFSLVRTPHISAQVRSHWKWFALHEGAMTIWHLRESLNLIPRRIGACAAVAKHVDRSAMNRAISLFDDQHFPNFKLVRDAIAHAPTITLTRDGISTLDDGLVAAPRLLDGDVYEVVNKGKRYRFAMTDDTVTKVADVVTTYWTAFAPVVKAFDQAGRED